MSRTRILTRGMIVAMLFAASYGSPGDLAAAEPERPTKVLPLAGETFLVSDRPAFLISPKAVDVKRKTPWVWYAPTLPGLPAVEEKWMFQKFLDAGIGIAGIDVGESYGSPAGRALYSDLYHELVEKRGYSPKPCLLARSRGGLMLYNWAVEHPDSVGCIAGIYPVCNLASYPGINHASGAYGLSAEQLASTLTKHNPISRSEPLAKAKVPIFHIHGDRDAVVPLELNSGELAKQYKKYGGSMTLSIVKDGGHDMSPGWFQSQELVDFVIANSKSMSAD